MPFSKKSSQRAPKSTPRKPKYDFISLQKRKRLISLVTEDQLSIYRASRQTGINNATAKVILKKYRTQGSIFVRKNEQEPLHQEIINKQKEQSQKMQIQQVQISTNNQQHLFSFQPPIIYQTIPCYLYQTLYSTLPYFDYPTLY